MNQKNLKSLNKLASSKYFIIAVFILSTLLSFAGLYFKDYFAHSKGLGLLGIFLINLFGSATFFVSGPAFLTVVTGGGLYNPVLVAVVASLGAAIGDLVSFLIGSSGRELTKQKLESKKWFKLLDDLFKRFGSWVVLIFAIIPNPLFDAVGLVAGVFGVSIKRFFVLTLFGRFIRFGILALIGAKIS